MDKQPISDIQDEVAIRLWDGDETVSETILEQYAPCIGKALAGKYSSFSLEDIEDIICEAIKRLWEKRRNYKESEGSVRGLLYKIADNIAKDILKSPRFEFRQRINNSPNLPLEEIAQRYFSSNEDKDALSEDHDPKLSKDLNESLKTLSEVQRKILLAYALAPDGKINSPVIGRELGIPAVTVRVYHQRAKEKVRAEMKKRGHHL